MLQKYYYYICYYECLRYINNENTNAHFKMKTVKVLIFVEILIKIHVVFPIYGDDKIHIKMYNWNRWEGKIQGTFIFTYVLLLLTAKIHIYIYICIFHHPKVTLNTSDNFSTLSDGYDYSDSPDNFSSVSVQNSPNFCICSCFKSMENLGNILLLGEHHLNPEIFFNIK